MASSTQTRTGDYRRLPVSARSSLQTYSSLCTINISSPPDSVMLRTYGSRSHTLTLRDSDIYIGDERTLNSSSAPARKNLHGRPDQSRVVFGRKAVRSSRSPSTKMYNKLREGPLSKATVRRNVSSPNVECHTSKEQISKTCYKIELNPMFGG